MRTKFRFLLIAPAVAALSLAAAPNADAQYHGHGHYGYGHGWHGSVSLYYGPYFSPFWWPSPYGYPGWYGGWYGGYGYGYGYGYPVSSVRIEVAQRDAKVFVDGYFAGVVDDYDGTFQRLRVQPGRHDIQLWLEGYRSIKQSVYLSPDSTYKIKGEMVKLAPGDAPDSPPPPPPPAPAEQQYQRQSARQLPLDPMPFGVPETEPPPPPQEPSAVVPQEPRPMPPPPSQSQPDSRYGRVAVRVQPGGADVLIDGERWLGPDVADRLVVALVEGRHHVEIRKSGFDGFATDIEVHRGETTPLNVSLPSH